MPFCFAMRRERYAHAHGGSFARFPAHAHFSTEQRRPFAHSKQANGARIIDLLFGDAPAVVLYFEDKITGHLGQTHVHPAGLGVANDVGERFLKDSEEGGV